MRQQVERVAGAQNRGHVGEDERGVGEIALASRDGHAAADGGCDLGPGPCDPGFVVPVADSVASGQRAVEMHAAPRNFAPKAVADGARGFDHDQRIDAAARARADGRGDGAVGVSEPGEARQRARLGAEQRGA